MRAVSTIAIGLLVLGSAGGAQVRTTASPAATAHAAAETAKHAQHDKVEHCKAMSESMGTAQMHSHDEAKGTVAQSAMNKQHADCQKMMKDQKKQAPAG